MGASGLLGVGLVTVALFRGVANSSQEGPKLTVEELALAEAPEGLQAADPRVSRDNRRVAFVQESDGQQRVVVNDEPGEPFDQILSGLDGYELALSPDGERVAYLARREGQLILVVDGQ